MSVRPVPPTPSPLPRQKEQRRGSALRNRADYESSAPQHCLLPGPGSCVPPVSGTSETEMRCSSPSALHRVRRRSGRLIPFHGLDLLSGKKLSKFVVAVSREKAAEVLPLFARGPITPQQSLDC